jgi:SAM-dependent methyltransferase
VSLLRSAGMLPLAGRRILDVGCGIGQGLADFETWGASRNHLAGIDLLADRVAAARARLPGADLRVGDASSLPWDSDAFDIVFQGTMFSSILEPSMKATVAREMARVLAPGGAIAWYDFFVDNPRNRAVRGIGRRELASLFPGFDLRLRRITLAPPLARRLAPRAPLLALLAEELRVVNTHYVGLLLPRSDTPRPGVNAR